MDIKVPKVVKIGGFDYSVKFEPRPLRLVGNCTRGECRHMEQEIAVDNSCLQQHTNLTWLHEVLHAVDNAYNSDRLAEEDVTRLAHGLNQVFGQLGINFVQK